MNLKKTELDFLISLANRIEGFTDLKEYHTKLMEIIVRLESAYEIEKKRVNRIITEKRKVNPFYGRSEKEKLKMAANNVKRAKGE